MRPHALAALLLALGSTASASGCAAGAAARPMRLRKVVLYQNGIGYFERSGLLAGSALRLAFPERELDDVLKTLTVIDRGRRGVATVAVRAPAGGTVGLDVQLSSRRAHDLLVAYAVPTPAWKAAYRVVLGDERGDDGALLQAWAMVNNVSQEDWRDVQLTLATGAPLSFALDLHTPEFVPRPDAGGRMVQPAAIGPVTAERAGAAAGAETFDSDHDAILDVDDKCPNEPEAYNGFVDEDGCPDRGRVIVTSDSIEILDKIYFHRDADELQGASLPIVDAIAATLAGNPDILRIDVEGHAAPDEREPWGLSARRAGAVRAALVARGVDPARLTLVPFGATRLIDRGDGDAASAKNRRVEFLIARRAGQDGPVSTNGPLDRETVQASVHSATAPRDVAGTVRYVLTEPVTIPRGGSTMVSILNRPVAGEDVFLFRPDANAPGSERHPLRAARLENTSGFTLEPGPVAIFARGTFVGEGLIDRLHVGETAWIPYALDSSTTVTIDADEVERPVRIVALRRGVLTVENAGVRTTRYTIAAGKDTPGRLFVRHERARGYTARDLPPGTTDLGGAYLVSVPLAAGKQSVVAVEEREPRRRTVTILDARGEELGLYVEGGGLPPEIEKKLGEAIAVRRRMGAVEAEIAGLRERLADVAARSAEVQGSLRAIEKVKGADDLRRQLLARLAKTTALSDELARGVGEKAEALAAARARVEEALRDLSLDEPTP